MTWLSRSRFCLLVALVLSGAQQPWHAVGAAERNQSPLSLSGALAIPQKPNLPAKDPFSPPAALAPTPGGGSEQSMTEDLPPLELTAILWRPERASAVVNGTILRPGDQFMGMQVLSISREQVHFQRGEGKLSLILHRFLYNASSSEGE